jgi:DNA invertase Pin-like site-specific DNA recombinase
MQYIYSRVSTEKQTTDSQVAMLKEMFPRAVAIEEVQSTRRALPKLEALLKDLKPGDELIVAALDRLGRRAAQLIILFEDLYKRGVIVKSVREGLDYSTVTGKMVVQILSAVAEMERGLISERTKAALAYRKSQGVRLGPPPTYSKDTFSHVRKLIQSGKTYSEISELLGISPGRISQVLGKRRIVA